MRPPVPKTRFWLAGAALGAALSFSACIDEPKDPKIDTNVSDQFTDCLAPGARCGGAKICCLGSICKGGVCSKDPSCVGSGGHCSASGECCGIMTCKNGVCDGGNCRDTGEHCAASADCCGAGLCRDGVCKQL